MSQRVVPPVLVGRQEQLSQLEARVGVDVPSFTDEPVHDSAEPDVLPAEAALALRDKAALMDLPIGIGIAVGPAGVTRSVGDSNVSVLGGATNLAARLQTAAAGGEILLSNQAFRRVAAWLSERGLSAEPQELELKDFERPQPTFRLRASVPVRQMRTIS